MAAVALSVSGCTADGTTPGAGATSSDSPSSPSAPSSSSAADPAAAAALGQATAALGTSSFKLTLTSGPGVKLLALVDAPNSAGTATLNITGSSADITIKTLLVGQDLYAQVPGITKAGTWTHLDIAKLPAGANIGLRPGQIDPAHTAQLLSSTTDVQQIDARSFKGSLDLTKATGITGIDQVTVDSLGTNAQNVPFTAGLDDQGRLSALTIQLPAVKGQQSQPLEVLYTDYGTKVDAQRPAASEITEAPANLYTTLGG
jgi:hypothetical protein